MIRGSGGQGGDGEAEGSIEWRGMEDGEAQTPGDPGQSNGKR